MAKRKPKSVTAAIFKTKRKKRVIPVRVRRAASTLASNSSSMKSKTSAAATLGKWAAKPWREIGKRR